MSYPTANTPIPFRLENYEDKYGKYIPAIQIALWIIVATGITLAVVAHYGYLDHYFIYIGSALATVPALIAIGILLGRKNYLETALDDASTLSDIKMIIDDCKISPLCCWANITGADVVVAVTSTVTTGQVTSNQVDDRIETILRRKRDPLTEQEKNDLREIYQTATRKCGEINENPCISAHEKYLK